MLEEKLPPKGEGEINPIGDAKKALQKAKYAIVEAVVEESRNGIQTLKKMRKSAELEGIEVKKESISSLLGLESKIEFSKEEFEYERLKSLVKKSAPDEKEPPKEESPKEEPPK
tara:strand:+ start:53 stop:394 length:342 start_codon:yes stop_codon:yes gene_type:complete